MAEEATKSYNTKLAELAAQESGTKWLSTALFSPWQRQTTATIINTEGRPNLKFTNVEALLDQCLLENYVICVIENIGPHWISRLGEAWELEPSFFLQHARKPPENSSWDEIFTPRLVSESSPGQHIVGILEYSGWETKEGEMAVSSPNFMQRHCRNGGPLYPVSSLTCISYYRMKRHSYLFLVDEPLDLRSQCVLTQQRSLPLLRLPYSTSSEGIVLPALYSGSSYRLSEVLTSVLCSAEHQLALSYMFSVTERPELSKLLVYLMSSSVFQTNMRYLQNKIERISFNDLRNPSIQTNDVLHDCRQDLVLLRGRIIKTRQHMPRDVRTFFNEENNDAPDIHQNLSQLIDDANSLSAFLMDSFQLLISTVSTLDAQHSLNQARESSLLTQLAFIYVPLSFVTGIYGMNVKEINGSPLSIWVAAVSLVVLISLTLGIFWALRMREDYKSGKKKFPKLGWKRTPTFLSFKSQATGDLEYPP